MNQSPMNLLADFATATAAFRRLELATTHSSPAGVWAEILASLLFTPGSLPAAGSRTQLVAHARQLVASHLDPAERAERRKASVLSAGRGDVADLYVPAAYRPRWLRDEAARALCSNQVTTVQVKSRVMWEELNYDLIRYSAYLDLGAGSLTRDEIVKGSRRDKRPVWKDASPDLLVAVRYRKEGGICVRVATRAEVQDAIAAHERWQLDLKASNEPRSWTATKLAFPHFFGDHDWSDWAVGRDVTTYVSQYHEAPLK